MAPVHDTDGTIDALKCKFVLTFLEDNRLCLYLHVGGAVLLVRASCREMTVKYFAAIASNIRKWSAPGVALSDVQSSEQQRRVIFDDAVEAVLGRRPKQTGPKQSAVAHDGPHHGETNSSRAGSRERDEPSPASKQPTKRRSSSQPLAQLDAAFQAADAKAGNMDENLPDISGVEISIADETFYLQTYGDRCKFSPLCAAHLAHFSLLHLASLCRRCNTVQQGVSSTGPSMLAEGESSRPR